MSGRYLVFGGLDERGRFHRDNALGRIFHPGTVSFREIALEDSLHVTVSPQNRVSVHVDRLSPLAVRPGRRCRYSLPRAVAHNLVHVVEALRRMSRRRRGRHRCELDCEATAVPAPARDAYEFSCKAAGAEGCRWSTRAATEEELIAKVADHARCVHGVERFGETLTTYALAVAREEGSPA